MLKVRHYLKFLILLFIPLLITSTKVWGRPLQRVLIIQSYSAQNPTAMPQERGIRKALKESGLPLEIKTFYMNTKTYYITPEAIARQAKRTRELIKKIGPDVIIVVDDNACREVMLKMVDTPYKFVFTGMNMPPEIYNQKIHFMESRIHPGHNITGVFEKLYIAASVRIAQEILPNFRKAFLFVSNSPTGMAIRESALYEMKKHPVPLQIREVKDLKDYQDQLALLNGVYSPRQAFIMPIVDRLKGLDRMLNLLEVVDFTLAHNHLPEIGGTLNMVKRGCLGAAVVDFEEMGKQAGEKAVLILKGTPPGNIPIEDARGYKIVINLKRAEELGLKIPFEFLLSADLILGGD